MYDAPAAEPSGFDFGGPPAEEEAPAGFNFGGPAEPAAVDLVGAAPVLAAPPSTGNFDSDMTTMKSHISELVASQVEALKQSASLRTQVDTLKQAIADAEKATEEAGAAEE